MCSTAVCTEITLYKCCNDCRLFIFHFSEFTATPDTPDYIHTGDSISLGCTLDLVAESELDAVKWYIDSVEVTDTALFTNAYSSDDNAQTTVLADSSVIATDGGVYKCEYTFNVGDAISFETTVGVHCKFNVTLNLLRNS